MTPVAKLFINGRSQAVRLPAAFRFDANEVFVRQDPVTGDVILSRKPPSWDEFFRLVQTGAALADFLNPPEREQGQQDRDLFEGGRMTHYLLDSHTASHLLKGHPRVALHISKLPRSALCI